MGKSRLPISSKTKQKLWVLSKNKCALTSCNNTIYDNKQQIYVGEIAHIEGYSPKGPRHNPNLSKEESNEFENLLLVCRNCHKDIDNNPENYPVESLKEFKERQEKEIPYEFREIRDACKHNNEKTYNLIFKTIEFMESTTKIHEVDSVLLWYQEFYNEKCPLVELENIGLPYAKKLISSFKAIINSPSDYTLPVIRYLCNRVSIYFSVSDELLANYDEKSELHLKLTELTSKISELFSMYIYESKRSVIEINRAIESKELHQFRDYWNSTDLRVVLKTLHVDKTINKSRNTLLGFVWDSLLIQVSKPSEIHIPETRHCWWALNTILYEWDKTKLIKNIDSVEKLIDIFISRRFVESERIKKTAVAAELHTELIETLWSSINIVRVMNKINNLNLPVSPKSITELEFKLRDNYHQIINDSSKSKFIVNCIKLIFFIEYEQFLDKTID